jgi:hypothetical protein
VKSFKFYTPTDILLGRSHQVKDEVGGTCGTQGRGEECVQGFDGKARRKETA